MYKLTLCIGVAIVGQSLMISMDLVDSVNITNPNTQEATQPTPKMYEFQAINIPDREVFFFPPKPVLEEIFQTLPPLRVNPPRIQVFVPDRERILQPRLPVLEEIVQTPLPTPIFPIMFRPELSAFIPGREIIFLPVFPGRQILQTIQPIIFEQPSQTKRIRPFMKAMEAVSQPGTFAPNQEMFTSQRTLITTNMLQNVISFVGEEPGSEVNYLTPESVSSAINTDGSLRNNISTPLSKNYSLVRNHCIFNDIRLLQGNSLVCGFPGFCDGCSYEVFETCYNTPLISCGKCGSARGTFFLFVIICLGLAILIGNVIIICVGWHRHRKHNFRKMDLCKSSLAVADLISGIQILVVTVYNFSWSVHLTSAELNKEQLALRGSAQAYVQGILYLFGFTSSLYHLIFIGGQRIYAIFKPIRYKWQTKEAIYVALAVVWILSLISSTIPAWFPTKITFTYLTPAFLFFPTAVTISSDYGVFIVMTVIFLVIPYTLMSIATIATTILLIKRYMGKSRRLDASKRSRRTNATRLANKQKVAAFTTVAIMQFGFTITLVPILIVVSLFYSGELQCTNISTPYLVCFYLSMANSLVNVIIYNIREAGFRSAIREIIFVDLISKLSCASRSVQTKSEFQPDTTSSAIAKSQSRPDNQI